MKKTTRKFLALGLLAFALGCEKEEVPQLQTATADKQVNLSVDFVGQEELPLVERTIDGTIGKGSLAWSHQKRDGAPFSIQREDVVKVTDSVGNRTYALGIQEATPTEGIFYNLVVAQRKGGKPIPPFVMRYKLDSGDTYGYTHSENQRFKGKVDVFSLTEFARAVGLEGKAGDPVPCLDDLGPQSVAPRTTSGTTGTGGGGGVSGTPAAALSGFTPIGIFSVTISVSTTGGLKGSVEVGQGHFLPALPDNAPDQKRGTASKDEIVICPDGTLLIPIKPVVQPEKIINELKGKELCIHNKMENTKNNYIAGVMSNFKGNSVFDIKIVSDLTLASNVNGDTKPIPKSNTILIRINSSKAKGSSGLSLAKTILHEYIHARMLSVLGTKLVPTTPEAVKFRNTYDSYKKTKFEPTPAHQTMADLYVNSMAEGLASFHKNELKEDYNKYKTAFGEFPSFDFYKALAWEGLSNQGVTAWTNLPESERKKFTTLQARTGMLTNPCN